MQHDICITLEHVLSSEWLWLCDCHSEQVRNGSGFMESSAEVSHDGSPSSLLHQSYEGLTCDISYFMHIFYAQWCQVKSQCNELKFMVRSNQKWTLFMSDANVFRLESSWRRDLLQRCCSSVCDVSTVNTWHHMLYFRISCFINRIICYLR